MPPRKRKAPASKLVAIAEDGTPTKATVNADAVEEIDKAVEKSCSEIMSAARDSAAVLRAHFNVQLLKLPKKVRDMTVDQFFSLSDEESCGDALSNILERLDKMMLDGPSGKHADVKGRAAAKAAPATAVKGAKATATATAVKDAIPRTTRCTRGTAPRVDHPQEDTGEELNELTGPSQDNDENEEGGSEEGGEEPKAAARTPLAAVENQKALATPAHGVGVGVLGTVGRLPANNTALAGFTLVKRTVVKGRTKASQAENSIMISTKDGQSFVVDGLTGLANVPAKYKREVAQQLEVMQKLAAAALNIK